MRSVPLHPCTRLALQGLCVLVLVTAEVSAAAAQTNPDTASPSRSRGEVAKAPAVKRGMLDWLSFWRDDRTVAAAKPVETPATKAPTVAKAASKKPATRTAKLTDPLRESTQPLIRSVASMPLTPEQSDTTAGARLSAPYPNPASTNVRIEYSTGRAPVASLRLYDFLGNTLRVVPLRTGSGTADVDVSQLSPGLYFYALDIEGRVVASRRMVVSR
jgi:Secretion system C-terminal sorting domain